MKIVATTIYYGPNIHSQTAVVHFVLDGIEEVLLNLDSESLLTAIGTEFPKLRTAMDSCRASAILHEPIAQLEHFIEHVCIELQSLAGSEVACARAAEKMPRPKRGARVSYEETAVCIDAANITVDLITNLTQERTGHDGAQSALAHFAASLEGFLSRAQRSMLPVQDRTMMRVARARNIPVARLVRRLLVFGQGRYQKRLSATKTTHTNVVSNDIAANKDYSRRVLGGIGLPIPRYERAYSSKSAVQAAERIGYPCVVKPNNGQGGRGVSIGMKSAREVRAAYKRAHALSRSVLVEEFVPGDDYRMVVIDGKFRAAACRVPGHIVGDGVHTVGQLLEQVNSDPRRGVGPRFSWTRIEFDDQAKRLLTELGHDLESIPKNDERVFLRRNANTSDGGTAADVTDIVHPDNRTIAERAARAIGLDVAGVDLLTRDISRSMFEHGGVICEINSRPGLRKHLWPAEGKPRDVIGPIIDMLFPPEAKSRLPVLVVTGIANRRNSALYLARTLSHEGKHVGLATDGRVYIDGTRTVSGKLTLHDATRMILLDPDVDAMVLDIDPAEVLQQGLSIDCVDVCVVIGSSEIESVAADDLIAAIQVISRCSSSVVQLSEKSGAVEAAAAHIQRLLCGDNRDARSGRTS